METKVDVDQLAQAIREVDGDHTLGAGALAEALAGWVDSYTSMRVAEALEHVGAGGVKGVLRAQPVADEREAFSRAAFYKADEPAIGHMDGQAAAWWGWKTRAALAAPLPAAQPQPSGNAGELPKPDLPPFPRVQVPRIDADIDLMDVKRLAQWCERAAKEYARAVLAAQPSGQWQPIETAPKDGEFLVRGGVLVSELYDVEGEYTVAHVNHRFDLVHTCAYTMSVHNPTEWIPLP